MEIMRKISKTFNFILIIISIFYSFEAIRNGDIYNTLIRLSIIPVLYIPYILRRLKVDISDSSIFIYSVFIFLGHFLGSIVGFYGKIAYYDTLMHTLFGFLFSFIVFEFLYRNGYIKNKGIVWNGLIVISIIAFLAVLWETFEFTCDHIFDRDAQKVVTTGVTDTMKDMIVAYLGSMFFVLMYAYEEIMNKKLIVKSFIKSLS